MQLELYNTNIRLEPISVRRRLKTQPTRDSSINSRADRLTRRNKTLIARYYYWTEIARRRFDDVIQILSSQEFFLDERTVSNILVDMDAYYTELLQNSPSKADLKKNYPSYSFD